MISVPERVLCLVAHPDDLEPQAGGTVLRFFQAGSEVLIYHAVIPEIDKKGKVIDGAKNQRKRESISAALHLGAEAKFIDFDPNALTHTQRNVQIFDNIIRDFNPDLIITHHEVDTQQDHVVVARLAQTVCRRNRIALWQLSHSFPGGYLANRPQPNLFVDVTKVHSRKMAAVRRYQSQVDRYNGLFENNWIETIVARDRYYGGMLNQDGMESTKYAEGFVVGKMVWGE